MWEHEVRDRTWGPRGPALCGNVRPAVPVMGSRPRFPGSTATQSDPQPRKTSVRDRTGPRAKRKSQGQGQNRRGDAGNEA